MTLVRSYHYGDRTTTELATCRMAKRIKNLGYWCDGTATQAVQFCRQTMLDQIEDIRTKPERMQKTLLNTLAEVNSLWDKNTTELIYQYWLEEKDKVNPIFRFRWSTFGPKAMVMTVQLPPAAEGNQTILPYHVHDLFELMPDEKDPENDRLNPDGEILHSVAGYKLEDLLKIDLVEQYKNHAVKKD